MLSDNVKKALNNYVMHVMYEEVCSECYTKLPLFLSVLYKKAFALIANNEPIMQS